MNKQDILKAFDRLNYLLSERNLYSDAFIVGGAAIALAYNLDRSTQDVDAYLSDKNSVEPLVSRVSEDLGLPSDWLNDAAKGFMPPGKPTLVPVYAGSNFKAFICTPEYLLSMKLFSARPKDLNDAVLLWNLVGYRDAADGLSLLSNTYPSNLLTSKMEYFVYEVASLASKEE